MKKIKSSLKSTDGHKTSPVPGNLKSTNEPSQPNNHPLNSFTDFYEKIFDALPIPIFVKDRSHRWILLNKSLCDLQDKKKEELLNRNDYDFFPKSQSDELHALEEQIFNSRTPMSVEEFTLRNGKESYVLIKKTVITDDSNNDYIVGGCIDITQRKKAEMLIEESERRFRSLVQNSPDIITILSSDAKIKYVTPSFFRILGFDKRDVAASSIYSFIHIDDVFTVQQKIGEIIKSPNQPVQVVFKAITKLGGWVILDSTIINFTQDPAVNGIVINASDITKLSNQTSEINRMNLLLEKDNIELKTALKKETKARVDLKIVDFDEFHKVYPDEESCYLYLSNTKWKNAYQCKRCLNPKFSKGKYPYSRRCTKCGFDESPVAGTIFTNQKFSVSKGFYMAFLIAAQNKITSRQLSTMVSLRKDTCATFKRNFLKIYNVQKNVTQLENGWESLLLHSISKSKKTIKKR